MFRFILLTCLVVAAAGCAPQHDPYTSYACRKCKPRVAFVPVVNKNPACMPWDMSKEMTDRVLDQLICYNHASLTPLADFQPAIDAMKPKDYFGKDLAFAERFCPNDFVVITELVNYAFVPYERGRFNNLHRSRDVTCQCVLSMAMRIQIVDLRCECPKLVLQEIFESNHMIPKTGNPIDYRCMAWESEEFACTPVGQAHTTFAEEVSARIDEVIGNNL